MKAKQKIITWLIIIIISGFFCFIAFTWLYEWIINIINQL